MCWKHFQNQCSFMWVLPNWTSLTVTGKLFEYLFSMAQWVWYLLSFSFFFYDSAPLWFPFKKAFAFLLLPSSAVLFLEKGVCEPKRTRCRILVQYASGHSAALLLIHPTNISYIFIWPEQVIKRLTFPLVPYTHTINLEAVLRFPLQSSVASIFIYYISLDEVLYLKTILECCGLAVSLQLGNSH